MRMLEYLCRRLIAPSLSDVTDMFFRPLVRWIAEGVLVFVYTATPCLSLSPSLALDPPPLSSPLLWWRY